MKLNLQKIKKNRETIGKSQRYISTEVLGLQPATYGAKERGRAEFKISELETLAIFYNIGLGDFFDPCGTDHTGSFLAFVDNHIPSNGVDRNTDEGNGNRNQ